jgi:hypothetical protein
MSPSAVVSTYGSRGDVEPMVGLAVQLRALGAVNLDSFTHGSSEQRTKWFTVGERSDEPTQCDTFSIEKP